jgi:hypothetical protein
MHRLRLFDLRLGDLAQALGYCADDIPRISKAVNAAQQRLLHAREAGDEGWWGTWAEMVFNVSRDDPYITCPRSVARLEGIAVCGEPIPVNNQFYEYLSFGNGLLPKTWLTCNTGLIQAYSRNNVPTTRDLTGTDQVISVYPIDPTDVNKSVIIQGTDTFGNVTRSRDVYSVINGQKLTLTVPFVNPPSHYNTITGIQKDRTNGPVQITQTDPITFETRLLLEMEPSEMVSGYRRYYLSELPTNCCHVPGDSTTVQVKAIAKLEFIPVVVDTDYCIIQNAEAIIEECMSIRYSRIDTVSAKQMSREHHRNAIGLLNGELTHYLGMDQPAVIFAPFGSAHLRNQKIGAII